MSQREVIHNVCDCCGRYQARQDWHEVPVWTVTVDSYRATQFANHNEAHRGMLAAGWKYDAQRDLCPTCQ